MDFALLCSAFSYKFHEFYFDLLAKTPRFAIQFVTKCLNRSVNDRTPHLQKDTTIYTHGKYV